MSFLNNTGVSYMWTQIKNYLTGAHVKTSVVSGATDVDGALTKLQTKTGTATLTTTAENLSAAVNELNSGLDAQSQQIGDLSQLQTTKKNNLVVAVNEIEGTLSTGTLSKHSSIESGTITPELTYCYKKGNVVVVAGSIAGMTNQIAYGTWFLIPEGYRPLTQTACLAYLNVHIPGNSDVVHWPCMATIYTDGRVVANITSGFTADQVGFFATYVI